jgi:hypothetical protein
MKYILALLLLTPTVLAFGQNSVDFDQLIKSWTEGKIDQNGKVIQADINKGGWYQLNINSDKTVIFGDPFTCGFGHERYGKWTLNNVDTIVTFIFSKSVGYMNSPGTENINEIEIYKISKLTEDELVLQRTVDGKQRTMPFVKTKK